MKIINLFFKKYWEKILLAIIIIVVIVGIVNLSFRVYDKYRKNLINDPNWLRENVELVKNKEEIYEVKKDGDVSIFNKNYQDIIEEKIDELKDSSFYTLEKPLLIYNPFGTANLSYYLYYTGNDENLEYKIETEGYNSFEKEIEHKDGNEYQLMGFVPGKLNTLTLTSDNKTYRFAITTPKSETNIDTQFEVIDGSSNEKLTDGLYAVLGYDKNYNSNIYLYDNGGTLRNELVLKSYRTDRIIFDDDYMYYAYKKNGIVKVNDLGKIEEFYDLGNYIMHHDMVYDKDNNRLVILVNEKNTDTIEDIVITLDLETKKVGKIIDMKDLLPEFYLNAVKPEGKNTYGGDELDWIHLNSLSLIGNDIVLSSRELSTIIYVSELIQNRLLNIY